MFTIEIEKHQLDNLKVFLNRVDLKGLEVPTFIEILNVISQAKENKDSN